MEQILTGKIGRRELLAGSIATAALTAIIGIPTQLLLPEGGALIARNVLSALTPTALMLVFILLSASFYRALSAARSGI